MGEGGSFYPIPLQKYQNPSNLAHFGVFCLLQAAIAEFLEFRPCFDLRSGAQSNFSKRSLNMPANKPYRANEYLKQCIKKIPVLKVL